MRLLRTIVAVWLAMALAALPFGTTAMASQIVSLGAGIDRGASGEAHAQRAMHVDGAMDPASQMSMDEPCHHDADPGHPASKQDPKCQFSPCCVGVSVVAAPSASAEFAALVFVDGVFPVRVDRFVPDHAGAPPFRPPRA